MRLSPWRRRAQSSWSYWCLVMVGEDLLKCARTHTHTHRKQEFDLWTVPLLRGQTWLFACGNKRTFDISVTFFIRKADKVRNKQITSFISPNDLFPISHSIKCFLVLHHDWANPLSPLGEKKDSAIRQLCILCLAEGTYSYSVQNAVYSQSCPPCIPFIPFPWKWKFRICRFGEMSNLLSARLEIMLTPEIVKETGKSSDV